MDHSREGKRREAVRQNLDRRQSTITRDAPFAELVEDRRRREPPDISPMDATDTLMSATGSISATDVMVTSLADTPEALAITRLNVDSCCKDTRYLKSITTHNFARHHAICRMTTTIRSEKTMKVSKKPEKRCQKQERVSQCPA